MIVQVPSHYNYIAFFSDLHGNLPALQAASTSLPSSCFVVGLGDYVGYYTEPDEVCKWMHRHGHVCIRGNHDAYAVGKSSYNPNKESDYRIGWTRSALSPAGLDWLSSLSTDAALVLSGGQLSFRLRHASPWDEESYIYPDTSLEAIAPVRGECLMFGHTHHPMARQVHSMWVINPGSVGQPRNYAPGAQYCLFDIASNRMSFHRIVYEVKNYQVKLRCFGVSERIVDMLSRERSEVASLPEVAFC